MLSVAVSVSVSVPVTMRFLTFHVVSVLTVGARLACHEQNSAAVAVHAKTALFVALSAGVVVSFSGDESCSVALAASTVELDSGQCEVERIVDRGIESTCIDSRIVSAGIDAWAECIGIHSRMECVLVHAHGEVRVEATLVGIPVAIHFFNQYLQSPTNIF